MNSSHSTVCMNACACAYAQLQSILVNLLNVNIYYNRNSVLCQQNFSVVQHPYVNSEFCDKHATKALFQTH